MGCSAFVGGSFRCTMTAGDNGISPTTNGYYGYGQSLIPSGTAVNPFGSIDKEPIPNETFWFCATHKNVGSLAIRFRGDLTAFLNGRNLYINGAQVPLDGAWSYIGAPTDMTVNGVTSPSFAFSPGNQYLIEFKP